MQYRSQTFTTEDQKTFIRKCLHWSSSFSHFSYFNPNDYQVNHGAFIHFLAAGSREIYAFNHQSFDQLKQYSDPESWLIGYFSYDLKNELEDLTSKNKASIPVSHCTFFEPLHLIFFEDEAVRIFSHEDPEKIFQTVNNSIPETPVTSPVSLKSTTEKTEYLDKIRDIQEHIKAGDIYELNFCMEFIAESVRIDAVSTYLNLVEHNPAPFSVLQKMDDQYLISASPERFIKKEGSSIISQPMKGTIRRGKSEAEDLKLQEQLQNSIKERAENIMIVDLVRNDLSRTAIPGTVNVEELFSISVFPKVQQMISTITSELEESIHPLDCIREAFPMGSMTGAPKIMAMKLIDRYENSSRAWYSGAAGYIKPGGDFDFNVIIRSMIYDSVKSILSYHAGSAITFHSDPEMEYEECMLKAESISRLFSISV